MIKEQSPVELSLKSQVSKLENHLRKINKTEGDLQLFLSDVFKVVPRIKPLKPKIYKTLKTKVSSPISSVLVLSDWHIGEIIHKDQTEDVNEFNLTIATKRIEYLCDKFLSWVNLHKSNYSIEELVIMVLGDLIGGSLHYELIAGNECAVPKQIVYASNLLSYVISTAAPYFPKIRVKFVVIDNHSRLTKKLQFKNAAENSYGHLIGNISKIQLEKCKKIDFDILPAIKNLVTIQKHRYLITHGCHGIRGWLGIPHYGIERMISKEAKARMTMFEKGFHKLILGHYHVPSNTSDSIMNGSLSGTSEFDIGNGRYSPPCQVAFMVHPKFGDFDFCTFFV